MPRNLALLALGLVLFAAGALLILREAHEQSRPGPCAVRCAGAVCRMMPDMIRLAEALYDQQAMPDDSGMPTLDAARAALDELARLECGEP